MPNIELETLEQEREQGVVVPGQPIAGEAPGTQLPAKLFDRAAGIETSIGGVRIRSLAEVMDVAKMMSLSGQAVPAHLRNNVGMSFAICLQALEWKMSPFAVANKSYVVNDRLNYESQLVHAVIEARAPLRERLRVRYEGEGEEMVCIVSGWFKGEAAPRGHRSPTLKESRPPTKVKDGEKVVKGSPLWLTKPGVQMFYDTSRDFCRIYCPDVLLGIYTPDEVQQYGIGEEASTRDITGEVDAATALHERLAATPKAENQEGYRPGVVEDGLKGDGGSPDTPKPEKPTGGRRKAEARVAKVIAETGAAPTTAESYGHHLVAWLAEHNDPDEVETRWNSEFKLRKTCGVAGGEEGTRLLLLKNGRAAELRAARKAHDE